MDDIERKNLRKKVDKWASSHEGTDKLIAASKRTRRAIDRLKDDLGLDYDSLRQPTTT